MTYHYYVSIMCYADYFCLSRLFICSGYVCGTLAPRAVPERQRVLTPGSLWSICLEDHKPHDKVEAQVQSILPCAFVDVPRLLNRNSFAVKVSPVLFCVWQLRDTGTKNFSEFHMQRITSLCPSMFARSVIQRRKSDHLK